MVAIYVDWQGKNNNASRDMFQLFLLHTRFLSIVVITGDHWWSLVITWLGTSKYYLPLWRGSGKLRAS